jgi:8-oxo-dGTP diphosphatase
VIDTATHTVVNTVSNASQPFGLAFSPDGSLVYGSNSNGGTVSVIDAATPNPHRNRPRHPWPSGLNANLARLTATVMGSTQLMRTPLPRRQPLQPHRRGARPTSSHSANVAVMPNQIVVAGALISGASLLVAQRTRPSELAGLWELPGGKVAAGESDAVALARELHEELDVEVTVGARLGVDVALNPTTTLRAYRVTQTGGTPHPNDHRALRWITFGELDGLAWVPADRTWLAELKQALAH